MCSAAANANACYNTRENNVTTLTTIDDRQVRRRLDLVTTCESRHREHFRPLCVPENKLPQKLLMMLSVDSNNDSSREEKNNENDMSKSRFGQHWPQELHNDSWLDGHKEWTYTMRRHMQDTLYKGRDILQEVVPGLFLGPYGAASSSKLQTLLDHRITHIICVRQTIEANFIRPNFRDKFKYLVLDIADTATENIIQHFQRVKLFIDEGLKSGGCVLVHGNAGISRSAALVLAYVMETYELSFRRAYTLVQQRRFCINPSASFIMQLNEYEPIYQAHKMLKNNEQDLESQRNKRTIHQIDSDILVEDKTEDRMDS